MSQIKPAFLGFKRLGQVEHTIRSQISYYLPVASITPLLSSESLDDFSTNSSPADRRRMSHSVFDRFYSSDVMRQHPSAIQAFKYSAPAELPKTRVDLEKLAPDGKHLIQRVPAQAVLREKRYQSLYYVPDGASSLENEFCGECLRVIISDVERLMQLAEYARPVLQRFPRQFPGCWHSSHTAHA